MTCLDQYSIVAFFVPFRQLFIRWSKLCSWCLARPLPDVHAATLADCKVLCDNYQDGLIECWAIKYQSSAEKCFMYVSVNPTNYFSTNTNNNPNLFYSTRGCFTCKYTKLENFYFWQFMTLMYIKELSFFKHYCVLIIFYHYKWNGKQTPHSRNS